MGWCCYNIYTSPKEECDKCYASKFKKENGVEGRDKILASCMKGNVYYAVIERTWDDDTPREVWAAIALTYYNPKAKKAENFGIKEIDETMGPHEYDMPEKYLDMLTETDNQFAKEWREKCRAKIAHKKALRDVPIGRSIKFKSIYDMQSGIKCGDEIILTKRKAGRNKKAYWCSMFYRWPEKFIPVDFEVLV